MLNSADQLLALREAGKVHRFHITPLTNRYDIAQHSYNMACIVIALHENPSANLLEACLTHDFSERWIGDIPASATWFSIEMQDAKHKLEVDIHERTGIRNPADYLVFEDRLWLKAIDKLELYLFVFDELAQGNRNVENVVGVLLEWFKEHWEELPGQVQTFIEKHDWKRLPDIISKVGVDHEQ